MPTIVSSCVSFFLCIRLKRILFLFFFIIIVFHYIFLIFFLDVIFSFTSYVYVPMEGGREESN